MKPQLCAAGVTLRRQINAAFKGRDKSSDGWVADQRHPSTSDHQADSNGMVRALDIDADLDNGKETSAYLAEQLRVAALEDKRIKYIIHNAKIASSKKNWAWRKYDGVNTHVHHIHISFTNRGDDNGEKFAIPLLERPTK